MRILFRCIVLVLMVSCCLLAPAQKLKLFSSEQRESANKYDGIVMDFLERYFNELPHTKHTTISTKMADDKVYFRNGGLSDLQQIADTMPFSINLESHYYEVEWKKQGEPFVTIVFPAQYDLLLGMQQEEAQNKLKETILNTPQQDATPSITLNNSVNLQDDICMVKTSYLELESFNDAIYYNKVGNRWQPYFNVDHLEYSAANLFHNLIRTMDYRMYVEQSVYGLKTINYTLTLRQWLDYCAAWGMKIYFAIEEEREDGLLALVIAECRELKFNHMLSVVIPNKFVTNRNVVFKARMTPYIPTHNVKDLFKKESVNRRKIKWQ